MMTSPISKCRWLRVTLWTTSEEMSRDTKTCSSLANTFWCQQRHGSHCMPRLRQISPNLNCTVLLICDGLSSLKEMMSPRRSVGISTLYSPLVHSVKRSACVVCCVPHRLFPDVHTSPLIVCTFVPFVTVLCAHLMTHPTFPRWLKTR